MSQYPAIFELSSLDGNNGFRIGGASAHDDSGRSVSSAGNVNGDGIDDFIVGADGASPNGAASGASYVVFGKASGFGATLDLTGIDGNNGFRLNGVSAHDESGRSVSSAGDVNGDGVGDLIVGAAGSGESFVVFGSASAFTADVELSGLDGNNGFRITGESTDDQTGFSVSSAGDVNGDGFADLVVGAPDADGGGDTSGAAYVVFGKASGFDANLSLSGLDGNNGFKINGVAAGDHSGYSVSSAGDINGDGFADLIVGAHATGSPETGASYVVFGKASGFGTSLDLSSLDGNNGFKINEGPFDYSGYSVSSAGDINGDGFGDIIVGLRIGSHDHSHPAAAFVVFGRASAFDAALDVSALNGSNGFQFGVKSAEAIAGYSVSFAGDVNGDGFADVVVSVTHHDTDHTPDASYVVFGKASGFGAKFDLSSLDGNNGFQVAGTGLVVSAAGDVNGDGFDDLIIGAPSTNDDRGASYVIYGAKPDAAVDRSGTQVANTIHGGNFNDTLDGQDGNDWLHDYRGHDDLTGGSGSDRLHGGGAADILHGGAGKDVLNGGIGADTFVYASASDSTGPACDKIKFVDFTADHLSLPVDITGIDTAINAGSFHNLATIADAAHLAAHHAVLFTADAGFKAGNTYLVVDMNGVAGYQAGEDLVVQLVKSHDLSSLGIEDFT